MVCVCKRQRERGETIKVIFPVCGTLRGIGILIHPLLSGVLIWVY